MKRNYGVIDPNNKFELLKSIVYLEIDSIGIEEVECAGEDKYAQGRFDALQNVLDEIEIIEKEGSEYHAKSKR